MKQQRMVRHLKRELIYRVMVKYIAPVLLLIILVFYTLAQFGVISY